MRIIGQLKVSLLLALQLLLLTPTSTNKKCFGGFPTGTQCECWNMGSVFRVKCPATTSGPQIILHISNNGFVDIVCHHIDVDGYKLLPAFLLNNTNVHEVNLENCPLPLGNISHFLDNLGLQNITKLWFVGKDEYGAYLTRKHLTGSSSPKLTPTLNSLSHMPGDELGNFENLRYLSLNFEFSTKLQLTPNIFMGCKNLETLVLIHNNLQQLPIGILRNQQKLQHLNLSNNLLHNISKDLFHHIQSISTLDLSSNGIESLPSDVFSTLTNLTEIYLNQNSIQELPLGLFVENSNLIRIRITNNRGKLKTVPSALFANLPHLKEVNIQCHTNVILENVFDLKTSYLYANNSVEKLIRITCNMCEIPGDLFSNSSKITRISLAYNEFVTLPKKLFADQFSLSYIDLSHNRLESLPKELFRDTEKLTVLKISHNHLIELPGEIFHSHLEKLFLDNNRLVKLPKKLFKQRGTNKLIELRLSYNQLDYVSYELLSPLTNLELLYLDNNNISNIEQDAFSQNKNLRIMNLENNHFYSSRYGFPIKRCFQRIKNLQKVNLRHNKFSEIYSDERYENMELNELDLSFNNISSLEIGTLEYLSMAKLYFNLTYNSISTVNFTSIASLEKRLNRTLYYTIDLRNNSLTCDCKLLQFVQYLHEKLSEIHHVKFTFITDGVVCNAPDNLKGINIRDVELKDLLCPINQFISGQVFCPFNCECWERSLDSVLIVNCSNSNLTEVPILPDTVSPEFESIELHMENNQLVQLPEADMPGYAKVARIFAAGNKLSQIDVGNLPDRLVYLDLSRNRFNTLSPNFLSFLDRNSSLLKIALAENPWNCDCDNIQLMQFVQKRYAMIINVEEIYCAHSNNHSMFEYLINNNVCQEDQSLLIALAVSFSVFGFLVALIAALYYKYQIEIKVWLYKYGVCSWLIDEKELDKDKTYDAFVSYSHMDEQFIGEYLVPELEHGPIRFKLCVHVRDFIVGESISDQIVRAIDDSRRTIVVLSPSFIGSVWARMEFRAAHQGALNEGRARVILIIYEDIGDNSSLDSDLKAYLKMHTYLKWGDPWFWDKLRYAMPHSTMLGADKLLCN